MVFEWSDVSQNLLQQTVVVGSKRIQLLLFFFLLDVGGILSLNSLCVFPPPPALRSTVMSKIDLANEVIRFIVGPRET